ncbi:MAG: bifunctional histidinol-phosphatase/imidazoleglycerol-phosphate dehydratase HisB [Bacteroidaceae bacterium]|nr:bifunctional histidinol-phosphatase/imidazoleglycerol-phosphate dehydratase HisB [Bacteroidaceae bacterium]
MKKALFIDRDGTIIVEPPVTEQVDTLEQLEFLPAAIGSLASIAELDYELVIASNQDGLGTESYPEERFYTIHNKMLDTLKGEGVIFDDQLIDPSFASENSPNRKPGTGMFGKYMSGEYDLAASYVIGDRLTDVQLACNLGAKAILITDDVERIKLLSESPYSESCVLVTNSWREISEFLRTTERTAAVTRKTKETNIEVSIDLDGKGSSSIDTGLKFLDHMIDQIVHHAGVSLQVKALGDLHVDEHHTMEDVAIVLGEAIIKALGNKRGIGRYGFVLPMDECEALVLIDFGGRIDFEWNVEFTKDYVGDVPTEMFKHFFKSLGAAMSCNLHIAAKGENNHHLAEGIFKGFARALRMAVKREVFSYELPSSKGVL